jgi:hypothetical protein
MPGSQTSIRILSADKALATFVRDNEGILFIVFLKIKKTIIEEYYVRLLEKLIRRIRRKRPNLEEKVFLFLTITHITHFA